MCRMLGLLLLFYHFFCLFVSFFIAFTVPFLSFFSISDMIQQSQHTQSPAFDERLTHFGSLLSSAPSIRDYLMNLQHFTKKNNIEDNYEKKTVLINLASKLNMISNYGAADWCHERQNLPTKFRNSLSSGNILHKFQQIPENADNTNVFPIHTYLLQILMVQYEIKSNTK